MVYNAYVLQFFFNSLISYSSASSNLLTYTVTHLAVFIIIKQKIYIIYNKHFRHEKDFILLFFLRKSSSELQ